MILCPNGHENPDGTTYCRVCDAYIDTITEPPPEEAPPPTLTADPTSVRLTAGSEAEIRLSLTNEGDAEDHYTLDLIGDDAAWFTVEPAIVSVAAGATGTASLTVRPPSDAEGRRSTTTVRATGSGGASEVQIDLDVSSVEPEPEPEPATINARIDPLVSRGTTHGDHSVTVDNVGSSAATARLQGSDPAGALMFQLDPTSLSVAAGTSASARLRVTPTRQLIVGRRRVHPFRVTIQPDDGEPVVVESRMVQRARIPAWLLVLLLVLVAWVAWQLLSDGRPGVDRIPIDVTVTQVSAPPINQVFDQDGVITPTDVAPPLLLPGAGAAGFLQSRSWPRGEPGTIGQDLFAYLYRIDLTAAGVGGQGVRSLRIVTGPTVPLPYGGPNPTDVFVLTEGGIGTVSPTAIQRVGGSLVFHFDPPLHLGESSFFFGFASAGSPSPAEGIVVDRAGEPIRILVTAPASRRAGP